MDRFAFVDGFPNTSFFSVPGVFPWATGQPNNDAVESEAQHCVTWAQEVVFANTQTPMSNEWLDSNCQLQRSYLCRRDVQQTMSLSSSTFLTLACTFLGFILISLFLLRREIRAKKELLDELEAEGDLLSSALSFGKDRSLHSL